MRLAASPSLHQAMLQGVAHQLCATRGPGLDEQTTHVFLNIADRGFQLAAFVAEVDAEEALEAALVSLVDAFVAEVAALVALVDAAVA